MVGFLGGPVQSQKLDLMVLVGPFQLRTFCGPHFSCIPGRDNTEQKSRLVLVEE